MKVEIISQLQNFGAGVTQTHTTGGDEVYNAILRWCADVVKDLRAEIERLDAQATKNLQASIIPKEYDPNADKVKIEIIADYYWKFVNYGVGSVENPRGMRYQFRHIRPSKKHIEAIKKWIVDRPVSIEFDDTDPETSMTNAAYSIATATKRDGIRARPFVDNVMTDDRVKELIVGVAEAAGKKIKLRYFGSFTNFTAGKK